VWKAAIVMDSPMNAEPGKVLQASGKFIVKCGVGAIALLHTDPELNVDLGAYL
jgi:hypothetical protein